jgi:hypothetical protein
MLFITVQPDGTTTEHNVEGETYPVLRDAVQGVIEPVYYADDLCHYHNEEFLYAEGEVFDQINFTVAKLSGALVYGPVIYTGGIDDQGETRGLSEPRAQLIREVAESIRDQYPDLVVANAHIEKPVPSFTITAW